MSPKKPGAACMHHVVVRRVCQSCGMRLMFAEPARNRDWTLEELHAELGDSMDGLDPAAVLADIRGGD